MSHELKPWLWIRFWNPSQEDSHSMRSHAVHALLLPDVVVDIYRRFPGFEIMDFERAYPDPTNHLTANREARK